SFFFVFFFSSRRRHTRFSRDWSSDVCSSDLCSLFQDRFDEVDAGKASTDARQLWADALALVADLVALDALRLILIEENLTSAFRSEERRVGKECRSRWSM